MNVTLIRMRDNDGMRCPHCKHRLKLEDLAAGLEPAELRTLWGSYCGSLQTPHAGPGRPRTKPRCPCCAMTLERARQRNHKCQKKPKVA